MADTSTRNTQRMTNSNGSTIGVDTRIIIGQAKLAGTGEALGGKGFVELYHAHIIQAEARFSECFLRSLNWADAHNTGLYAHHRRTDDASEGFQAILLYGVLRSNNHRSSTIVQATGITSGNRTIRAEGRAELG